MCPLRDTVPGTLDLLLGPSPLVPHWRRDGSHGLQTQGQENDRRTLPLSRPRPYLCGPHLIDEVENEFTGMTRLGVTGVDILTFLTFFLRES